MLEINRTDYEREKEARERRLKAYADEIQNQVRDKSREIVKELVVVLCQDLVQVKMRNFSPF